MDIKKELLGAVIEQIPVVKYFKGSLLTALFPSLSPIKKIEKEVTEYCNYLKLVNDADKSNAGAGLSAATDIKTIISKIEITPTLIGDIGFNPEKLALLYKETGNNILEKASSRRKGFIEEGLDKLSFAILITVVDLPEYKLEFYKRTMIILNPHPCSKQPGADLN